MKRFALTALTGAVLLGAFTPQATPKATKDRDIVVKNLVHNPREHWTFEENGDVVIPFSVNLYNFGKKTKARIVMREVLTCPKGHVVGRSYLIFRGLPPDTGINTQGKLRIYGGHCEHKPVTTDRLITTYDETM